MDDRDDLVVRALMTGEQAKARRSIRRGLLLLASVPILVFGSLIVAAAFDSMVAFTFAMLGSAVYVLGGGIAGTVMIASGVADHRLAARELRQLEDRRKLPEARLLR